MKKKKAAPVPVPAPVPVAKVEDSDESDDDVAGAGEKVVKQIARCAVIDKVRPEQRGNGWIPSGRVIGFGPARVRQHTLINEDDQVEEVLQELREREAEAGAGAGNEKK